MPERIQRLRLFELGYRMPPGSVYVGRPTKWGNPFNWRDADPSVSDTKRKEYASLDYKNWLTRPEWWHYETERRNWILDHLSELRGKDLACWCKPGEPCHADVLIELANEVDEISDELLEKNRELYERMAK